MFDIAGRGGWKVLSPLNVVLVAEVGDVSCDGDCALCTFLMACERRDFSCADSWELY